MMHRTAPRVPYTNDPRAEEQGRARPPLRSRAAAFALWASVVAERMGLERHEALTLGFAAARARPPGGLRRGTPSIGLAEIVQVRARLAPDETVGVEVLGRAVAVVKTRRGLLAVMRSRRVSATAAERHLATAFGAELKELREAMAALAASVKTEELAGYALWLFEHFAVPAQTPLRRSGTMCTLDVGQIRQLSRSAPRPSSGTSVRLKR